MSSSCRLLFWDIASYLSKVKIFTTLRAFGNGTPLGGGNPLKVYHDVWHIKQTDTAVAYLCRASIAPCNNKSVRRRHLVNVIKLLEATRYSFDGKHDIGLRPLWKLTRPLRDHFESIHAQVKGLPPKTAQNAKLSLKLE